MQNNELHHQEKINQLNAVIHGLFHSMIEEIQPIEKRYKFIKQFNNLKKMGLIGNIDLVGEYGEHPDYYPPNDEEE